MTPSHIAHSLYQPIFPSAIMQFSVASLFATVALLFGATQVAAIAADPCTSSLYSGTSN